MLWRRTKIRLTDTHCKSGRCGSVVLAVWYLIEYGGWSSQCLMLHCNRCFMHVLRRVGCGSVHVQDVKTVALASGLCQTQSWSVTLLERLREHRRKFKRRRRHREFFSSHPFLSRGPSTRLAVQLRRARFNSQPLDSFSDALEGSLGDG